MSQLLLGAEGAALQARLCPVPRSAGLARHIAIVVDPDQRDPGGDGVGPRLLGWTAGGRHTADLSATLITWWAGLDRKTVQRLLAAGQRVTYPQLLHNGYHPLSDHERWRH